MPDVYTQNANTPSKNGVCKNITWISLTQFGLSNFSVVFLNTVQYTFTRNCVPIYASVSGSRWFIYLFSASSTRKLIVYKLLVDRKHNNNEAPYRRYLSFYLSFTRYKNNKFHFILFLQIVNSLALILGRGKISVFLFTRYLSSIWVKSKHEILLEKPQVTINILPQYMTNKIKNDAKFFFRFLSSCAGGHTRKKGLPCGEKKLEEKKKKQFSMSWPDFSISPTHFYSIDVDID